MTNFNHENDHSTRHETLLRDRFELLSAYIDGEVSAVERRQVEEWLSTDPSLQQLHRRLLHLQHAFDALPAPVPQQSSQQLADAVFERVERSSRWKWLVGGFAAAAAVAVAAIATIVPGEQSLMPQMAQERANDAPIAASKSEAEPLLIALDKPLVDIPKAPVSQDAPRKMFPSEETHSN
jgi:anti-sigma factor RsiW